MSLGLPPQTHKYLQHESHTKERREGSGVSTQHDHSQIHESQGRILGGLTWGWGGSQRTVILEVQHGNIKVMPL